VAVLTIRNHKGNDLPSAGESVVLEYYLLKES